MPQAKNLDEAIDNLVNVPLTNGRFNDFFVDTTEARGGEATFQILKRELNKTKMENKHYLLAGAKGCGKSTELMRLQLALPDFLIVSYSVKNELDIFKFTHPELLIATMKKLFEAAQLNNLVVDERSLQLVLNWVDKMDTEIIKTAGSGLDTKAGVTAKAGLPGLLKIFTELTVRAKFDTLVKETIHKSGDNLISQLIDNCNILINEIKHRLHSINKQGLLIIIEDLDKIDLKQGEELFLNYASRLVALNVNTIYTYPISLIYHPKANIVLSSFDYMFLLPMIKTHTKNGLPYMENGQLELKTIVEKRMSPELFESPELMMKFIRYSGGVIFDLLRTLRDAVNSALNHERNIIIEKDWLLAYYRLIDYYRSMIADRIEGNTVVIKAADYNAALVKVALSETKQPENTREELELRQNLCILSYNSEAWIDVHPAVKEILILKQLIDVRYRIQ